MQVLVAANKTLEAANKTLAAAEVLLAAATVAEAASVAEAAEAAVVGLPPSDTPVEGWGRGAGWRGRGGGGPRQGPPQFRLRPRDRGGRRLGTLGPGPAAGDSYYVLYIVLQGLSRSFPYSLYY